MQNLTTCTSSLRILTAFLASFSATSPSLAVANSPASEGVRILNIFAPVGFDDNDNVEFVVNGALPNTCYKIDDAQVVIEADRTIRVTQKASRFDAPQCLVFYVPFSTVIHIGRLPHGDYKIVDTVGGSTKSLHIGVASNPMIVDEFLYAPVEQATVQHTEIAGFELTLQGWLPNDCLSLSPANVKITKAGNVIEVLPVMTMESRSDCAPTRLPFTVRIRLPVLSDGPYLAHVRGLTGKAINTMFYALNE